MPRIKRTARRSDRIVRAEFVISAREDFPSRVYRDAERLGGGETDDSVYWPRHDLASTDDLDDMIRATVRGEHYWAVSFGLATQGASVRDINAFIRFVRLRTYVALHKRFVAARDVAEDLDREAALSRAITACLAVIHA